MATVSAWTSGALTLSGNVVAPTAPNGFVFKAVQPGSGVTGTTEPLWPLIAGNTVADGTVTWEAVTASSITWEAVAIYKSGPTEPNWPSPPGTTVSDGSIVWLCTTYHVADAKCPNTKQVVIAGSKVHSAAKDVVRYSATSNPLDWSTVNDAGFLPTGLQAQVDPIVQALGIYRGNLVPWSGGEMQVWQVDPDPTRMALVDNIPSIGTNFYRSHASMAGDLYFTTRLGIRSVSIAGGSTNLQAGDVGTPIDELVQPLIPGSDPIGLFYPGGGQFWEVFGDQAFVYSQSRIGGIGAWGIYDLPGDMEAFTQQDGWLYFRVGNKVYRVDDSVTTDDGQPFDSDIVWNWLDMGAPGVEKSVIGVDVVGSGAAPTVSIGYNQTDPLAYTPPYQVVPDTYPGRITPIPCAGPSFSLALRYRSTDEPWELTSASVYLNDFRPTS